MTGSAANRQLRALLDTYVRFLPKSTFPLVPFIIASVFQVFAWFGGRFLGHLSLVPRVMVLWLFALGEYAFMSPAMNAATEVLNMSENALIILYSVAGLVVFAFISLIIFRNKMTMRHVVAMILLAVATLLVYH